MDKKSLIIGLSVSLLAIAIFLIYQAISNPHAIKSKAASSIKVDDKASVLNKAKELLAKGDEDAAIKDLKMLIVTYPDSNEAESGYFMLGSIYEKRHDFLKAKDVYQRIIEKFPNSTNVLKTQEALGNVNIKLLFSPIITPDSFSYEVQKGDTLTKIAKKFGTTVELITKANDLRDTNIKFGKKIKISKAKFSIVVDKSQNILTLKSGEEILKTYKVSTGKDSSTPVGNFKITTKVVDPVWYTTGSVVPAGSPKNILGSRWMGISLQGYGIHGTIDPQSIGKSVTAGCIRMTNPDVEELYSIVPEGTEVVIVD